MKLADFKALCDREWKKEPRGDVLVLRLTDDSRRELAMEIMTASGEEAWLGLMPKVLRITEEQAGDIAVGASITEIFNPVTRSPVRICGGATTDMAEVCVGLRVVPL